jgi:hypothetical protein
MWPAPLSHTSKNTDLATALFVSLGWRIWWHLILQNLAKNGLPSLPSSLLLP